MMVMERGEMSGGHRRAMLHKIFLRGKNDGKPTVFFRLPLLALLHGPSFDLLAWTALTQCSIFTRGPESMDFHMSFSDVSAMIDHDTSVWWITAINIPSLSRLTSNGSRRIHLVSFEILRSVDKPPIMVAE